MIRYIDTHCHLGDSLLISHLATIMEDAHSKGVFKFISVFALDELNKSLNILKQYPDCFAAYGIHPLFLPNDLEQAISQLETILDCHPTIAIGEIGLDFYYDKSQYEQQIWCFEAQLVLAKKRDLPILLHMRRSIEQCTQILKKHGISQGIAHAFSGSLEQAEQLIKMGFKIGIGGTLTYPNSKRIRRIATHIPLDSIVLETDSPDIPPSWLKDQPNTPAQLAGIAQTLAELRNIRIEEIADMTTANVITLFGWNVNEE